MLNNIQEAWKDISVNIKQYFDPNMTFVSCIQSLHLKVPLQRGTTYKNFTGKAITSSEPQTKMVKIFNPEVRKALHLYICNAST